MNEVIIKKRLQKKNAQAALLSYVIHNLGGPKKLSTTLSAALGEPIAKDRIMLWRSRGSISMPLVKRVAEAWGISPYLLNFKHYRVFSGEDVSWRSVVEKCPKLSPMQKKDVLSKKAPE